MPPRKNAVGAAIAKTNAIKKNIRAAGGVSVILDSTPNVKKSLSWLVPALQHMIAYRMIKNKKAESFGVFTAPNEEKKGAECEFNTDDSGVEDPLSYMIESLDSILKFKDTPFDYLLSSTYIPPNAYQTKLSSAADNALTWRNTAKSVCQLIVGSDADIRAEAPIYKALDSLVSSSSAGLRVAIILPSVDLPEISSPTKIALAMQEQLLACKKHFSELIRLYSPLGVSFDWVRSERDYVFSWSGAVGFTTNSTQNQVDFYFDSVDDSNSSLCVKCALSKVCGSELVFSATQDKFTRPTGGPSGKSAAAAESEDVTGVEGTVDDGSGEGKAQRVKTLTLGGKEMQDIIKFPSLPKLTSMRLIGINDLSESSAASWMTDSQILIPSSPEAESALFTLSKYLRDHQKVGIVLASGDTTGKNLHDVFFGLYAEDPIDGSTRVLRVERLGVYQHQKNYTFKPLSIAESQSEVRVNMRNLVKGLTVPKEVVLSSYQGRTPLFRNHLLTEALLRTVNSNDGNELLYSKDENAELLTRAKYGLPDAAILPPDETSTVEEQKDIQLARSLPAIPVVWTEEMKSACQFLRNYINSNAIPKNRKKRQLETGLDATSESDAQRPRLETTTETFQSTIAMYEIPLLPTLPEVVPEPATAVVDGGEDFDFDDIQ